MFSAGTDGWRVNLLINILYFKSQFIHKSLAKVGTNWVASLDEECRVCVSDVRVLGFERTIIMAYL